MRKIREVLRFEFEESQGHRSIAVSCHRHGDDVQRLLETGAGRARRWSEAQHFDDAQLEAHTLAAATPRVNESIPQNRVMHCHAMWGLVGAELAGNGRESTEVPRRSAVVVFPAMFLFHAIFVRALAPDLQIANLVAAAIALVCGLAFRWARRARVVLSVMFASTVFVFLYMFGLAAPLSYLAIKGRHEWMPWTALASVLLLGTALLWRVRSSIAREWSKPLDQIPGIHIATEGWILRRESVAEMPVLNLVATVLGGVFVMALALMRHSSSYLLLVMAIAPVCIALLMTDAVAQILGFYAAVRRWERQHGVQLRFPPLSSRASQTRLRRKATNRGRKT